MINILPELITFNLHATYTDTRRRNFSFSICLKNDLRSNLKTISSFPFMNHTLNCFNEIVLHVCCTLLLFICILTRKYLIFHRIVIILISTISESWRDVPSIIKRKCTHILHRVTKKDCRMIFRSIAVCYKLYLSLIFCCILLRNITTWFNMNFFEWFYWYFIIMVHISNRVIAKKKFSI